MTITRDLPAEIGRALARIRKALGVESLDFLIAQSEVEDVGGTKVVVKRFSSEVGLLKWLPPALLLRASYPFALAPRERLRRELEFMRFGGWRGLRVPKILSVDEGELIIVREFVEGEPLRCDRPEDVAVLGRVLAEVHGRGFSMGDVKPTNFLLSQGTPYVVDAEQSAPSRDDWNSWDLAVASFFVSLTNYAETSRFRELFGELSKAYLDSGGNRRAYCEVLSPKNAAVIAFMPLPHLLALTEVRRELCR